MNLTLSAQASSLPVAAKRSRDILLWFVLSTLLLVLKSPDALQLPQFWAEDATVFFADQLHGSWPQVLHPYSGYLHFLPRVAAWFASFFPLTSIPLLYNVAAILVDAACVTFVTLPYRPVFWLWRRVPVLLHPAHDRRGVRDRHQRSMVHAIRARCGLLRAEPVG